ncbi:MAG: THUMP domain-containing protein [Leptospiraceae bacterium]|nr:THUMP domain-containing protein [Leptospiraceae bacterium]
MSSFFTNPDILEFHSSCGNGFHDLLLQEVEESNLNVLAATRGGVHFKGKKNQLKNFLLRTKFSSRVALVWKKWRIRDAEELYDLSISLPFEQILKKDTSFRIESFTKDNLSDSRYALYKLKDAIRDRIREKGYEVNVERENPDVEFLLRSHGDEVDLQVSISPKPFHKRGYRLEQNVASLRETLAQGLIAFSGWKPESVIIDPMCGAGTILTEAALQYKLGGEINRKLLSESIIFESLFGKPDSEKKSTELKPIFFGYDNDSISIEKAKRNAERAGVLDLIHFEKKDIADLKNEKNFATGYILTNPPYGVRMGEKEYLKEYYSQVSNVIKKEFPDFFFGVIAGDKSLLGNFRLKAEKELSVSIAKLKGKLVLYKILKR